MKPVVVFGDVHGQSDQLAELVRIVRSKFGQDVDIYSVGDLIDRGPDSKGVIQICIDEGIKAIGGNHEEWIKLLVSMGSFDPYALEDIMGGKATALSYDVDLYNGESAFHVGVELFDSIPKEHKDWLSALPYYRKINVDGKTYWLLHGGLTKATGSSFKTKVSHDLKSIKVSDDEMMKDLVDSQHGVNAILWNFPYFGGRKGNDNLFHFDNACQIFGHKIIREPIIKEHFIALDTGCGTRDPYTLSAIVLPTKELIQVKPINNWA